PRGEVYVAQVHYRARLNAVLGVGQWGLIPLSPWAKVEGKDSKGQPLITVVREWGLYIRGRFLGQAAGEADYHPNNLNESYATACESSKSNALVRCCKDLGIGAECWDKRWIEGWKARSREERKKPENQTKSTFENEQFDNQVAEANAFDMVLNDW